MRYLKRCLEGLMQVELAIGALMTLYIIAIMVIEIIMRYVFNNSIIWVQESVMLAFIWVTALGAIYAMMTQSHIVIDTLVRALPESVRRPLKVLVSLAVIAVLVYLVFTLPTAIHIQNRSKTASLPINFPKGYYYSLPIFVSAIEMLVVKLYYLVYEIKELLGQPSSSGYELTTGISLTGETKVEVL